MQKVCQNCKKDFIIESDDFSFYEKIKVPPPTFCPECRAQRRFMWRNERTLYKRTCDLCKESFIALYPQDSPYKIYCKDCWYGDKWDSLSFGLKYDSSKDFFTQFKELQLKVPRLGIWTVQCHNSPYTNQSYNNKNCYLCFGLENTEDSFNVTRAVNLKKCFNIIYSFHSENLYNCVNLDKSYNTFYAQESETAIDSFFISECRNVQNCFGTVNERGSSYIFLGKKLSKDEYIKKINQIDLGDRKEVEKYEALFEKIKEKAVHKYAHLINCPNSIGDHLTNARNCKKVFDGFDLENAKYSAWVFTSKEIWDCYGMGRSEFAYEAISPHEISNTKFVHVVDSSNDVEYSEMCKGSSSLFGCISLQKKKYCILNKQYTKEEYEKIKNKIIEDMKKNPYIDKKRRIFSYGEFFPYDLAPYAYNETIAQEFFPLSEKKVQDCGFKWKNSEERHYSITLKSKDIPNNIKDVEDSILQEVIECSHEEKCMHQCTSAFKITNNELSFYRSNKIPLPILCPNCRYYSMFEKKIL